MPHEAVKPSISLVVAAYNMNREIPRTIFSLSQDFQINFADINYEIILVDNGSDQSFDEPALRRIAPQVRVIRVDNARVSPASAINAAMDQAQADFVGVMIDGARIASPGLLRCALAAHRLDPDAPIGTYGFHLGPEVQMESVFKGYDQATEDKLLDSVDWTKNGYRLFEISVFAGSSARGWFDRISESNAVFMARDSWNRLNGLDERFESPGGGNVNLDFWKRAVDSSRVSPVMLLGEGTFHQVHGGAATNSPAAARAKMNEEYEALIGEAFKTPEYKPRFVGHFPPECSRTLEVTLRQITPRQTHDNDTTFA